MKEDAAVSRDVTTSISLEDNVGKSNNKNICSPVVYTCTHANSAANGSKVGGNARPRTRELQRAGPGAVR